MALRKKVEEKYSGRVDSDEKLRQELEERLEGTCSFIEHTRSGGVRGRVGFYYRNWTAELNSSILGKIDLSLQAKYENPGACFAGEVELVMEYYRGLLGGVSNGDLHCVREAITSSGLKRER